MRAGRLSECEGGNPLRRHRQGPRRPPRLPRLRRNPGRRPEISRRPRCRATTVSGAPSPPSLPPFLPAPWFREWGAFPEGGSGPRPARSARPLPAREQGAVGTNPRACGGLRPRPLRAESARARSPCGELAFDVRLSFSQPLHLRTVHGHRVLETVHAPVLAFCGLHHEPGQGEADREHRADDGEGVHAPERSTEQEEVREFLNVEACGRWGFRGCPPDAGRSGQAREAVRRGEIPRRSRPGPALPPPLPRHHAAPERRLGRGHRHGHGIVAGVRGPPGPAPPHGGASR